MRVVMWKDARDVKARDVVELVEGYPLAIVATRHCGANEAGRVEFRCQDDTGMRTTFKTRPDFRLRVTGRREG